MKKATARDLKIKGWWCRRIPKTGDIAYREYRDTRRPSRQRPASWAGRGRPPHPEQPPRLLKWRIFYSYRFYFPDPHHFVGFRVLCTMHGPIQSRETVPLKRCCHLNKICGPFRFENAPTCHKEATRKRKKIWFTRQLNDILLAVFAHIPEHLLKKRLLKTFRG